MRWLVGIGEHRDIDVGEGRVRARFHELPPVPTDEVEWAAEHLMRAQGAAVVVVLDRQAEALELARWIASGQPIGTCPGVLGVMQDPDKPDDIVAALTGGVLWSAAGGARQPGVAVVWTPVEEAPDA